MNALNLLVFGLIAVLAVFLLWVNSDVARMLEDHSVIFLLVIGVLGLVGAREKTPDQPGRY